MPLLTGREYEGLAIADGKTAGLRFLEMAFGKVEETERAEIARALTDYCGLDTEGMIEIVEARTSFCLLVSRQPGHHWKKRRSHKCSNHP